MSIIPVYDSNGGITKQGVILESTIYSEIQSLFDKLTKNGYSPRDISHIVASCSFVLESSAIILMQRGRRNGSD